MGEKRNLPGIMIGTLLVVLALICFAKLNIERGFCDYPVLILSALAVVVSGIAAFVLIKRTPGMDVSQGLSAVLATILYIAAVWRVWILIRSAAEYISKGAIAALLIEGLIHALLAAGLTCTGFALIKGGKKLWIRGTAMILISIVFLCPIYFSSSSVKKDRTGGNAVSAEAAEKQCKVLEPKLSAGQNPGVAVLLDYEGKDKIIFHGAFGLFIYDTKKENMLHMLDLEPIGCDQVQGADCCDVRVTEDGETVYLIRMKDNVYTEAYRYQWRENELYKMAYNKDILAQDFYDCTKNQGVLEEGGSIGEICYKMNGKEFQVFDDVGGYDEKASHISKYGEWEPYMHKRNIVFRNISMELWWKAFLCDEVEWIPQIESEGFMYGEEEYFFTLGGVYEREEEVWAVLKKRNQSRSGSYWEYPVRYDLGNGAAEDFLAGIFVEGKELFDCTDLEVWKEGERTFAKKDGKVYFLDLATKEAVFLPDILGVEEYEQFFWLGDGNYVYTVDKGENLYDGYLLHWETGEQQQLFANQEFTILQLGQSKEPAILLENGYLLIGRGDEVFLRYYLNGKEWKIEGLTFEDTLGLWNYDRHYIYFNVSQGDEGEIGVLSLEDKTYKKYPFYGDWNGLMQMAEYGFYLLDHETESLWSVYFYDFLEDETKLLRSRQFFENEAKEEVGVSFIDYEGGSWAIETVKDYAESMGKDWNRFLKCFTKEKGRELKASFPNLLRERRGVCNVKSAKLLWVGETLYNEEVWEEFSFSPETYQEVKVFKVEMEYETYEDTSFYVNGASKGMIALAREGGIWKVADYTMVYERPQAKK